MNLDHPAIQRCLVADGGDIDSAPLPSIHSVRKPSRYCSDLWYVCDHGQSTVADPSGLVRGQTDTPPQLATENHARPIRLFPFPEIGEEQYSTYLSSHLDAFRAMMLGLRCRTPAVDLRTTNSVPR